MILILSFGLFSFGFGKSKTTFKEALRNKKIEIKISSNGSYSGKCINIELKNLSRNKLNLEMISGTLFVPDDSNEQTLVTPNHLLIAINRNEVKLIKIAAFCTEANDKCPSKNSKFTLSEIQNFKLLNLFQLLDSLKNIDNQNIQQAIWCITDNQSVSNIYCADAYKSIALRKYLCSVTGQNETWYNTKSEVSIDKYNHIVRTTKEINGIIEFISSEAVELQGFVKDSLGNIVYKNPNKTLCPAGKIKLEFNVKVADWKEGKYDLVYTNNGKELISKSFSF